MSEESDLKGVPAGMRPVVQYFIGHLLMLKERLTYEQWSTFDRSADVICNSILRRMLVLLCHKGGCRSRAGSHIEWHDQAFFCFSRCRK